MLEEASAGKRFPAVIVIPQLMSPCTEEEAHAFHADELVHDVSRLVDAVLEVHEARKHSKST